MFVCEKSGAEEELFHLVAQTLGQIADVLAAIGDSRISDGNGDKTVVALATFFGVFLQPQNAHEATLDDDAWKSGRVREDKNVEWVPIVATGAWQKSPAIRIRETENEALTVGKDI